MSQSSGDTTRYLHDISGIHSQQTPGGEWVFPIMDALGSVRGVVNPAGEVLEGQDYAPYGTPFGHTGTAQTPFGFTGEVTDTSGLVYLRARYYLPGLGVFPSLDPVEEGNRYGYVGGDVVNRVDPSGAMEIPPNGDLTSCFSPVPTCPSARSYVPNVNYGTRVYVDDTYARSNYRKDWFGIDVGFVMQYIGHRRVILAIASDRASAAGNVNAARMLKHWLFGGGSPILDHPVETMLQDLPKWREDASEILNTSLPGLISQTIPLVNVRGCSVYQNNTLAGTAPSGQPTWRRVGQGSQYRRTEKDIYADGIDISVAARKDIWALLGDLPSGASYSRSEFDWFIALNAFDYSIAEGVVVDAGTGEVEVCYRADIADEYVWYEKLGGLDAMMASDEEFGVGRGFEIRGSSTIRCERFNIREYGPDARYNNQGTYLLRGF